MQLGVSARVVRFVFVPLSLFTFILIFNFYKEF
jgi:hypothetical protein